MAHEGGGVTAAVSLATERFGDRIPFFCIVSYGINTEAWCYLRRSAHYLQNALPGALVAIGVREPGADLFGEPTGAGPLRGLLLLGRPIARVLPQDGTMAEITRLVLDDGFPKGTASNLIRFALETAPKRGIRRVDALHDRSRHSGCVYRKAGMRKLSKTKSRTTGGWESRNRSQSAIEAGHRKKQRWTWEASWAEAA